MKLPHWTAQPSMMLLVLATDQGASLLTNLAVSETHLCKSQALEHLLMRKVFHDRETSHFWLP